MPADERIKVSFARVYVLDDADWFGTGEFYFIASIDGKPVGDRSQIFDAVERQWIVLPEAKWSAIVDVNGKTSVAISFQGKDEDVFFLPDDDLGTIRHTLRPPWEQRRYLFETSYYRVEVIVELAIEGAFGMHAPGEVFVCRAHNGSGACTTVSGTSVTTRIEFHPVIPMPPDAPVVPAVFPARAPFPPGTGPAVYNAAINGGISVTPTSDLNVIPNPSVIPILTAPGGAAPAGGPPVADATNTARIEFTYYRPNIMAFTDNDARLEWTAVSVAGGAAVRFLGAARGTKVKVYGTTAGEIRLEVRLRGALLATYRALVMRVKQIPCRFNILNGPTAASQPRSTPANVLDHLAITNRFLRQAGVELVLDTNPTRTNNAKATGTPGIFRIKVSAGTTRNISATGFTTACRLNYRPNVMNFAYIVSDAAGVLGAAEDYPASNAGGTISDSGTPSSSWILPTGILPDAAAGPVNMTLLPARQRAGHPRLFSMYVTNANGDPSVLASQQTYANTMAHEIGHILNLGHRVDTGGSPFNDNVNHPPNENLMHWMNPPALAQDLDLLQTRAIHQSPLVPP